MHILTNLHLFIRRYPIDVMIQINPTHLHFLRPLVKWKILTKEKLFFLSGYSGTYKAFHKIVRNFERKGLLQGYRDFFSRKKYLYATELGNELIFDGKIFTPNHQTIFHDTRVSEIVQEATNYDHVKHYELEHAYRMPSYDSFRKEYYPDAYLDVVAPDTECKIAVELELTQKSTDRIHEKFNRFIDKRSYSHVLYLFSEEAIWKKYIDVFKTYYEEEHDEKFMFLWNSDFLKGKISFNDCKGYYNQNYDFNFCKVLGKKCEGD